MNRFSIFHWIAAILVIIALLWITISYYSYRVIPLYAFAVLFAGLAILIFAEFRKKRK